MAEPRSLESSADVRVVFVGDSYVNGTGDESYQGWTGRVCGAANRSGHGLTHYNLGVRGDTSADVLFRWRAEVERRLSAAPDGGVVFSFGANDAVVEHGRRRVEPEESEANLAQLLEQARERWPVLVVGPPPTADSGERTRIRDLSERFERVCKAHGTPWVPVFAVLDHAEAWQAEVAAYDGAHPSASGYVLFAQVVLENPIWRVWLAR